MAIFSRKKADIFELVTGDEVISSTSASANGAAAAASAVSSKGIAVAGIVEPKTESKGLGTMGAIAAGIIGGLANR